MRTFATFSGAKSVMRVAARFLKYLVLSLHGLTTLFPLLWVISNSFRSSNGILTSIRLIPETFDLSNYKRILLATSIPMAFLNSSGITVLSLGLLFATVLPLAYALSRFSFRGARYIYGFFVIAILLPAVTILPMSYRLMSELRLLDRRFSIVLIYTCSQMPISIFLMTTFMASVPREVDESAMMDGAGPGVIFARIIVPLSRNGVVVTSILAFVHFWNEYVNARVILTKPAFRTLTLVVAMAKDEFNIDYGLMMAAIIIAVTPMVVFYVFIKDLLMKGMTMGAVKG